MLEILKRSKGATAIYDTPDLRLTFVNSGMLEIWGRGKDIIGRRFGEIFPEFTEQGFTDILKNVWVKGQTYEAKEYPANVTINGIVEPRYFDNPKYGGTLGYFDASYLKIRTMTLGYNFENNPWIKNIGIQQLRLYAAVQNPFVMFSPYHRESGMDPETNSYGDENAAVTSTYQRRLLTIGTNAPATRNYLIGVNLTF